MGTPDFGVPSLKALHAGNGIRVEELVRLHGDGAMNDILSMMEKDKHS